ncbi:MAG: glycoside hydrolase family 5 protein [Acidobacteriota bacterium]|jgi:endoglucanase|nr:glycoside hydrolase family 5 protein [Acidobacteriota bacterium]
MKKIILISFLLVFGIQFSNAQTIAQNRAEKMGLGMNLSYLDNYWLGSKEKNFADFAKSEDVAKREKMFSDIKKAGFSTVRIPVNFGAWASLEKTYKWNENNGLEFADKFVKWALDNDLNAVIDLHHVEFDGSVKDAAATERIVWLWSEIAKRYKNTNPEKVFFEIRNEPHNIEANVWREQAEKIIRTIRSIAPKHTLIVGFHDWNSRKALVDSKPFDEENIIYTFHYYDPFIFTHQGATWAGEGLPELSGVEFPYSKKIKVPQTAKGKWVEDQIKTYKKDSDGQKMFADLKAAKDWSLKNSVPIFLGEFGSFTKFASEESRCRHAKVIYNSLGKLDIPSAWWEWDGGFNMFEKGTNKISKYMQDAVDSYKKAKTDN